MFCVKCGNRLDESTRFCPKCGTAVSNNSNVPQMNNNNMFIANDNNSQPFNNNMSFSNNQSFNNNQVSNGNNYFNNNQNYQQMNNKKKWKVPNFKSIQWNINTILVLAIIIVVLISVIGIGFTLSKRNQNRVVMIYMVGADLESRHGLASVDLQPLDYTQIANNNVKIVIMAGGSRTWKNNFVDSNETSIYELQESGFVKVEQRELNNMGEANNLSYFLNYVYKNYKASKYNLIFWDHGGAVDGSEYDEKNHNDNLKPVEMRQALEASPFNSRNKLDTVSFRTCLNATIEIANVYKDFAKYLIASEEVTVGADSSSALEFLNIVTAEDESTEFGMKQIEGYKEAITKLCNYETGGMNLEENYCVDTTYSLVDLSKIPELDNSLENFFKTAQTKLNTNYNEMAKIRASMNQYGADYPDYDMIDLYDLISKYEKYAENEAKKVIEVFNKAVIHSFANNDYSHGISIYFPYNASEYMSGYENISPTKSYTSYINNFYNLKSNKKVSAFASFSNVEGTIKKESKEKADFELELTDEQVENFAKANYFIFADTKDGNYQLLYTGKEVTLDGNILKAKVQGKQLRFSDIEYEEESCWISLTEKEVTDDHVDVTSIAILKYGLWDMQPVTITIRIDKEHPNGYILSITTLDNQENENKSKLALFSNKGIKLSDYTSITYANSRYNIVDENGNFNPNFQSDGIIRGIELNVDEFKYIKEDFDSEYDYYALFRIWDTANNVYHSKLVKMEK